MKKRSKKQASFPGVDATFQDAVALFEKRGSPPPGVDATFPGAVALFEKGGCPPPGADATEKKGCPPPLGAQKYDADKLRMSLLPRGLLWGVISVLEYGARKYGGINGWQNVPDAIRRYHDAMDRHWGALMGETRALEMFDTESHLHHAYHFLCNATFLAWFAVHRPDLLAEARKRAW